MSRFHFAEIDPDTGIVHTVCELSAPITGPGIVALEKRGDSKLLGAEYDSGAREFREPESKERIA